MNYEVCGKVMFLQASVILFLGGMQAMHACPCHACPPPRHACHLPHTHPDDMVNERVVRILLECILVVFTFVFFFPTFPL